METNDLNNLKSELELLESIDLVEFEYKRKPFYTPNDPRYNNQWYIDEIRSNDAWDIWDIAAGTLIVSEAGGKVNDINKFDINNINIRASNNNIFNKMLENLKNF